MFLDKYDVKCFDDFVLNKSIIKKVKNYFNDKCIYNTFLYGPSDNGKFTIIRSILHFIYGDAIYNLKDVNMKINVNGTSKEVKIKCSNFHYEIYLNNYLFNDRISLSIVIKNISENINVNNFNI